MRVSVQVKIEPVNRLFADLVRSNPAEINRLLDASGLEVESKMRPLMRQDTRALMNSVHSQRSGLSVRIGPSLFYGYFQEFGRKPGKPPPISAIEGWARRHNVNPFAVARAIGQKGVKPQPFLEPALRASLPGLRRLWSGFRLKV